MSSGLTISHHDAGDTEISVGRAGLSRYSVTGECQSYSRQWGKHFPNATYYHLHNRCPSAGLHTDDSAISAYPTERAWVDRFALRSGRWIPSRRYGYAGPLAGKLLPQRCRESHSVDIQRSARQIPLAVGQSPAS